MKKAKKAEPRPAQAIVVRGFVSGVRHFAENQIGVSLQVATDGSSPAIPLGPMRITLEPLPAAARRRPVA